MSTDIQRNAVNYVRLSTPFRPQYGGMLEGAKLAYETFGHLNDFRDNVVLILPGLSADIHVCSNPENPNPGWWEGIVGPDKAVDTNSCFVICFNYLGGCKGSTGPGSNSPMDGIPYGARFPALSIEDIVDAVVDGLRSLGLDEVAVLIGTSMGGMCALALMTRYPGFVKTHINICGAASSLPFSTALRSLQREAIKSDPLWSLGNYSKSAPPVQGLALARKIGMLSYRSEAELNFRFSSLESSSLKQHGSINEFGIEDYLSVNAIKFATVFDPNSYLVLSRAIDHYACLQKDHGGFGVSGLTRALVIGVESDALFPVAQQQYIAESLSKDGLDVVFFRLKCPGGHDAFLTHLDNFSPLLKEFMTTAVISFSRVAVSS